MKTKFKVLLYLILIGCLSGLAAEENSNEDVLWGSYFKPGNTVFGLAGAYEMGRDLTSKSIGLYPSMEVLIWKPVFSGYAPVDFGLAAEGRFGLPLSKGSGLSVGVAAEGSIHVGFRGFDFPGAEYLDRLEVYARMGVSFDIIHPKGFMIGTVATSGANYFLDDNLMLGLSYTGWGNWDYGVDGISLQVRYRMGKSPQVKGMGDAWKRYEETVDNMQSIGPVTQFYAFLNYSVFAGGYTWESGSYAEGTGTLFTYIDSDDDSFSLERILIQKTSEGEWWSLKYLDEELELSYEYFLDNENDITTLYYVDEEGSVKMRNLNEENTWRDYTLNQNNDWEELASDREDVTVPAGTFKQCYFISEEADGQEYKWYFTPDEKVPGQMVKFTLQEGKDLLTGQLSEIITGRKGVFHLK